MKRALLVSFGLIMLASYAGCLPDETNPTGVGGSTGTAGTSQTGSAGTTGSAGSSVAGTTGSGGDSSGTAGSQGGDTSGTAGNGTAGSQGGDTSGTAGSQGGNGTAGSTAGNSGGGRGGSAGSTAGTSGGGSGGSAGTGTAGSTAGTTGRGGSAGTGTAGTGSAGSTGTAGTSGGLPSIGDLFPVTSTTVGSFDGRLLTMPCGDDNPSGTDCGGGGAYYSTAGQGSAQRIQCSGGSLTAQQVFNVGGETGKTYTVTIHIYGISEPKNYGTGVTREAGTGRPALTPNGNGATPTPWATAAGGHTYPVSDYNTSEIRVCRTRACATGDETNVYYLNADTREGHWTYVLNYTKQIQVVGGGSIRVKNYDRNCRQIKNCGPEGEPSSACANDANARVVNTSAAMPAPVTAAAASGGLQQPNLDPARPAGSSGQWLLIDVVKVDSVQ